jgi:citrate lyase subunit beta/citryl-CoA lyase
VTGLESAVTFLFVPGDRPERFAKAARADADLVVCDLEDAVAPTSKTLARTQVAAWLEEGGRAVVRINAAGTAHHADDLCLLAGIGKGLAGVIVPMAESAAEVAAVVSALPGVPVLALVETARGVRAAAELAAVDGVVRLGLGHLDLAVDLGCLPDDPLIEHCRHELLLSARAAGGSAPVDGVTPEVRNLDVVTCDARRARNSGFGGKLCIHPAQVEAVAAAFAPSKDDIAWAEQVEQATAGGATLVAGVMVDAPVVARARSILKRAGRQ